MDENMSEDDSREEDITDSLNNINTDNKRLKIDHNCINSKSEESSSSSSNITEQETASTSTDSGFPKSRNTKNRNYRNHNQGDSNANDSGEESGEHDNTTATENATNMSSLSPDPDSSNSTVINDTDTESEDTHPVLLKEKPKDTWFQISQIMGRQFGYSPKIQSSDLFRMKAYGSVKHVRRMELLHKLDEHDGCVNSLNFHPDGSILASGSDDLRIILWDWKTGKILLKYDSKHKQNVFQSKFLHLSGDLHIASCARDGQVRIAQVSREEGLRDNRKLGSHRGPCNKLAVIPDQPHLILSAGEDGVVLSHDLRQPKPDRIVTVKEDERDLALYSIDAHPLKTYEFCVSGRDEVVRAYDQRRTNCPLNTYHPFKSNLSDDNHNLHVTCAVYNYNGSEILASYSDEDIYLFDINGPPGNYLHRYQGHRNGATIKGVNFFGLRSEFVVSGSDCGHVFFWEKNTEAIVNYLLADDNGVVNCLEPHPTLPYICTSGLDSDVKVWVPTRKEETDLQGLPELLRRNKLASADFRATADMNESQMLWLLWRRLRNSYRSDSIRRMVESELEQGYPRTSSSDSSSDTEISHNDDDDDSSDDQEGPAGCTTS